MFNNFTEFLGTLEKLSQQLQRFEKEKQATEIKTHKRFSTKEAAEFLNVSERTLYTYRKNGLRSAQIGRKITFSLQDLEDFLNEHQVSGEKGGSYV